MVTADFRTASLILSVRLAPLLAQTEPHAGHAAEAKAATEWPLTLAFLKERLGN